MVLATHIVTGGLIGSALNSNPALALVAGFASHFLLDAIPHWDYQLSSLSGSGMNEDDPLEMDISGRNFLSDLRKIILDVLIGAVSLFLLARFLDWSLSLALFLGVGAALLPDFLQFVYFQTKSPLLRGLQHFHIWIHSDWRLDGRYLLGPFLQILLVLVLLAIIRG